MADRVVILSERPTRVKKIIPINITNKSTPISNRKSPEFNNYYEMIWKEIDIHV